MFNNLVESDLHPQERVRRSWFFLGTLAAYAVLLMLAGVASIYAYDAHLDELTAEYDVTFVPPVEPNVAEPERNSPPRATTPAAQSERQIPERREAVARVSDSTTAPEEISSTPSRVRELPPGQVVINGREDIDVATPGLTGGPAGRNTGGSGGGPSTAVHVDIPDTPPPPRVVPPRPVVKSGGVLNGDAISLPKPVYPSTAKLVKASGMVMVQVLIDETGKVVSAQAVSGHSLLRAVAVEAAYKARFRPTLLSQQPVKVSGVITYNFVL
ncbi:MAG TPA: energy transducer TonB [Pyrinomonadaceae bacterium]|jgi:protein TonB|nr:energy transducer TonB [Pyrinomonadaceae bacterium]